MKKGDLRRESILAAAERLFFEKGYEQTSIQDILDALSMSKGGFYHHFSSKEAIFAEICVNRVEERFSRLTMELYGLRNSPIEKMNLLLRMVNLFERDEPKFVAMMLKLCYIDNDVRIRDHMRRTVLERLRELVDGVLTEGMVSGDFFTRYPGQIGEIALNLAADVDEAVCRMMASDPENPEVVIGMVDLLHACRDSLETLLGAPFGSIQLFDPNGLLISQRIAAAELVRLEASGS